MINTLRPKYSSSYVHDKLERQHSPSPDVSPNDPEHHSSMKSAFITKKKKAGPDSKSKRQISEPIASF